IPTSLSLSLNGEWNAQSVATDSSSSGLSHCQELHSIYNPLISLLLSDGTVISDLREGLPFHPQENPSVFQESLHFPKKIPIFSSLVT
ncbi:hypothetical protein U1Q18_020670, partial [Sarracenia purpurea var. burkii]